MQNRELEILLTYDQLADRLQVSPGTLRNWVSQQFIPHVKLGRAVRFEINDIQAWIKKRANEGRVRLRGS